MIDKILNNFKENYDELGMSYYPEDILGPDDLKPLYDYIIHLQSNWNSLRKWLKEYEECSYGPGDYEIGLSDGLEDTIKKMKELEREDK